MRPQKLLELKPLLFGQIHQLLKQEQKLGSQMFRQKLHSLPDFAMDEHGQREHKSTTLQCLLFQQQVALCLTEAGQNLPEHTLTPSICKSGLCPA
jgi:hypothetical protein